MQSSSLGPAVGFGVPVWMALFAPIILILIVWSIFWKGLALWHSAQRGQAVWFIVMLVLNTAGILEIVYLFAIAKLKFSELFTNRHKEN